MIPEYIPLEPSKCVDCHTPADQLKEPPWSHRIAPLVWGIQCKPCRAKEVAARIEAFEGDTDYMDAVVCPYCGEVHEGDGEDDTFYTDGDHDFECMYCFNSFKVNTSISPSYTTEKYLSEVFTHSEWTEALRSGAIVLAKPTKK